MIILLLVAERMRFSTFSARFIDTTEAKLYEQANCFHVFSYSNKIYFFLPVCTYKWQSGENEQLFIISSCSPFTWHTNWAIGVSIWVLITVELSSFFFAMWKLWRLRKMPQSLHGYSPLSLHQDFLKLLGFTQDEIKL